jgi:hypothetical protein
MQNSISTGQENCRYNNADPPHLGFLRTMITESPRRNILLMNLSLLTGWAFFLPFPVFGTYREETQIISSRYYRQVWNRILHREAKSFHGKYYLSPHFPDIFKNHVAVPIEGSDTTQQLSVIPTINQHLLGGNNSIRHFSTCGQPGTM